MTSTEHGAPPPPEALGPYRVLRRLGAGGMGEVFEAVDERLDRRVAVKRLPTEGAEDPERRRRLRREARIAAQLNHPCLVQIYDILELPDGDFLVLELVEGSTLKERLSSGPLSAPDLLRLGEELAEGLQHAHERGIIHRDLKPANVLLTPGGRAKIADFGIAKHHRGGGEDLTRGKALIGTYRNMSPEQARGRSLDHRSDLFSLGLLLYEAAAGVNPFADDNPLATLRKLAGDEEPPLATRRPDLPAAFTALIHRLLAKAPELRPQSATEVLREIELLGGSTAGSSETLVGNPLEMGPAGEAARKDSGSPFRRWSWVGAALLALAVLAGFLAAGFLALGRAAAPVDPVVVAVPLPQGSDPVDEGDALDLVPEAVRFALISALLELEGATVLAASEVDAAGSGSAAIARGTGADEVLASELACRRQRCWVTLSRIAAPGQEVVWTERLEAPADDLYLLSQAVMGAVRKGYTELAPRRASGPLEVRPEDYREFLRLEAAFADTSQGRSMEEILKPLAAIRQSSPRFLNAYLLAAEARRMEFVTSRNENDLAQAFELLDEARALAPEHPLPLSYRVNLALTGSRLEEAEDALEELSRLAPGWVQLGSLRAHLLEAKGREEEALEELRRVALRRPSRRNLSNLANMEFRLGNGEESRRLLRQALALAPGDFTLRTQLALVELLGGSAQEAAKLYGELVAESPGFSELSNLGLAYLLLERYGEARERFQAALTLAPNNVFAMLNLADAHWLAGERSEAEALYRRLLETLEADPAADGWQFLTVKAQALAHLGRFKEAVAAVAHAQRRAPENAQVAYESALVYALAGDRTSASVQAERALSLGYDSRWLTFPWFDGVLDLEIPKVP